MIGFDVELLRQLVVDSFDDLTRRVEPVTDRLGLMLLLVAARFAARLTHDHERPRAKIVERSYHVGVSWFGR